MEPIRVRLKLVFINFAYLLFIVSLGVLTDIKTRSIVPVDLNALLFWNAQLLSEFYAELHDTNKSRHYDKIANEMLKAVEAVHWHEEIGSWLDYDLANGVRRDYFYPTNIAPLWTGCYDKSKKDDIVHRVMKYLQNKHILYIGGVPSTLEHTGEQWDYPNAWPPLQHIMIEGLNNTGVNLAVKFAAELADIWVRANFLAFKENQAMFEKVSLLSMQFNMQLIISKLSRNCESICVNFSHSLGSGDKYLLNTVLPDYLKKISCN